MVEPVSAILTGIALVTKSVDFVKKNISTVQDIGELVNHVEKAFEGQNQVIKEREKAGSDIYSTENVAKSVINARLAEESLYTMKMLIDARFGHGTWAYILKERKRRIDERKQAVKEAKAKAYKKRQEMMDNLRMVSIGIFVIIFMCVVIGVGFMFLSYKSNNAYAHNVLDDTTCMLYEPKYYVICLSEGRGYADTQLYLDHKLKKDNWIIEED